MSKVIDLTGQFFGTWLVLERATNRLGQTRWLCRCNACGFQDVCLATYLKQGGKKCYRCKWGRKAGG